MTTSSAARRGAFAPPFFWPPRRPQMGLPGDQSIWSKSTDRDIFVREELPSARSSTRSRRWGRCQRTSWGGAKRKLRAAVVSHDLRGASGGGGAPHEKRRAGPQVRRDSSRREIWRAAEANRANARPLAASAAVSVRPFEAALYFTREPRVMPLRAATRSFQPRVARRDSRSTTGAWRHARPNSARDCKFRGPCLRRRVQVNARSHPIATSRFR